MLAIIKKKTRNYVIMLLNFFLNMNVKGRENRKALSKIRPFVSYDINKQARIIIGTEGFTHRKRLEIHVRNGALLEIGDNVFFNNDININCHEHIIIGKNCLFGPNVMIFDHDHVLKNGITERDEFVTSPIIIGNNVWIGAGTVILKGARIGDNCVIGAGSVVVGDIQANSKYIQKRNTKIIAINES